LAPFEYLGQRDPQAPEGFPFEEKRVRYGLGLNKNEAREIRKRLLSEGDFAIYKKRLYLSQGALEKMRSAVQPKTDGSSPGSIVREPEPLKAALPETLRVVNPNLKNPHMILACAAEDRVDQPQRPLRVRVRSQAHFVTGMEIPAIQVAGSLDLYDLARACPRKRGRW